MNPIVTKFGGSSLASANEIARAAEFVRADQNRRYVVVSAPGKRAGFPMDMKVTDMLRGALSAHAKAESYKTLVHKVKKRFEKIRTELGLTKLDLTDEYEAMFAAFKRPIVDDFVESRGEYFMARIMAELLGYTFVDAKDLIAFDKNGFNAMLTNSRTFSVLERIPRAVIPGYYGSMLSDPDSIKVFSRGGSDISGAIVARAVNARLYENGTDVPGVLACDPRIMPGAHTITTMTGSEVRELAYMGASVLHPDALLPVLEADIPTRVFNVSDPSQPSTLIQSRSVSNTGRPVGVAARKGFSVISVTLSSMNPQIGFARSLLEILETRGVSLEHMPGGLDSLSFIIDGMYSAKLPDIVRSMRERYPNAVIKTKAGVSLLAVVGEGMVHVPGTLASLATSLARANINVSVVNQGASELVILFGVDDADANNAIRAIYRDCIALR